jgi:hypothetical protein
VDADIIGKGKYTDYMGFKEFCPSHIIYKIPSPSLFSSHLTQIQVAHRSKTSAETQYIIS